MLKFMRGPSKIIRCLFTIPTKIIPTSISHFKLYCLRTIKENNSTIAPTKKKSSQVPIQNEILIYEYNNSKFFLKLGVLSFLNYTFWILLGVSTYGLVSVVPENAPGNVWFSDETQRNIVKNLTVLSVVLGTLLLASIWLFIFRNIKTIILRQESKEVVFETFTPFCITRRLIVPLNHVSGVRSRHSVKGYVPLKIRNKLFYFLLDVNGRFKNPSLFDSSLALKRNFKDQGN